MKKTTVVAIVLLIAIGLGIYFLSNNSQVNEDYIRIHIRANSDSEIDQNVKLSVRDSVINLLTPILAGCNNFSEAKEAIGNNLEKILDVANQTLSAKGQNYTATVKLTKEEFPIRSYGDLTLESGIYDALIIELGESEGANWWCVAFPPLCFVPENGTNVKYKSKILEIIRNYTDNND